MTKTSNKIFFIIVSVLVLFSADQVIKYIIRQTGGFYICNAGVTFGVTLSRPIIHILYLLFIVILIYLIFRRIIRYNSLSLILVFSGAMANLTDRIILGCVVDYIDIRIWPVFNLADIMIVAGAILLIVQNAKLKVKN